MGKQIIQDGYSRRPNGSTHDNCNALSPVKHTKGAEETAYRVFSTKTYGAAAFRKGRRVSAPLRKHTQVIQTIAVIVPKLTNDGPRLRSVANLGYPRSRSGAASWCDAKSERAL